MKLSAGTKLVVASHNEGKVREIMALIGPYGLEAVSAGSLGIEEPVEDGATFAENAALKARASAIASGLPALADDSGLEVEVLDGAPGIYSARWGGEARDFELAMRRVIDELNERGLTSDAERRANFICVLALADPSGEIELFEGKVFGHLVWPGRGHRGFGYDPIFVADNETLTFGEMDPDEKHKISHRAHAFELFRTACLEG